MIIHAHDTYIRENYAQTPVIKMAAFIGRSRTYVSSRLKNMGLKTPASLTSRSRREAGERRTTWTPVMDQYLRDNYLDIPVKAMAVQLERSGYGTFKRMEKLNIVVPESISLSRKRTHQFKSGHTAHNKGKKLEEFMPAASIEKIKKTQFKKGNQPHNTKKDGAIARHNSHGVEYDWIRISKANWIPLSHHVYQEKIGPIKKGEIIIFKNGNTLDCTPANLDKITKAENMKRNGIYRYGIEIGTAIRRMAMIKKELNK
jgi:hypothetical protein